MQRVNTADAYESSIAVHRTLSPVVAALLVGVSYYVGSRIGFAWTPSGQPEFELLAAQCHSSGSVTAGSTESMVDVLSGSASRPHVRSITDRSAGVDCGRLVHHQQF